MGPTGRATAVAAVADVIAFDMIVEDAFTGAFDVGAGASSTTSSTASFDSGNPSAGGSGKAAFTGNPPAGIGGGGGSVAAFTGNPPAGMGGGGGSVAAFAGNPPTGSGGGGGKDSLEGGGGCGKDSLEG